jgi:hypothetical protein
MTWIKGWNFRQTTGPPPTDGTNETYALETVSDGTYPVSRNGAVFGYPIGDAAGHRTRDTGLDRRLAGTAFCNLFPAVFRIDLIAAGPYLLRGAFGDAYTDRPNARVEIFDDTTSLFAIDHTTGFTTTSFLWRDINDNLRNSTTPTWLDTETRAVTFATTTCLVQIGVSAGSRQGFVSHFSLEQVEAGATGGAYHQTISRVRGYGRWT